MCQSIFRCWYLIALMAKALPFSEHTYSMKKNCTIENQKWLLSREIIKKIILATDRQAVMSPSHLCHVNLIMSVLSGYEPQAMS